MADLITSCFGGRNRKVADLFARSKGAKSLQQIEKEVMDGQLLQGPGDMKKKENTNSNLITVFAQVPSKRCLQCFQIGACSLRFLSSRAFIKSCLGECPSKPCLKFDKLSVCGVLIIALPLGVAFC